MRWIDWLRKQVVVTKPEGGTQHPVVPSADDDFLDAPPPDVEGTGSEIAGLDFYGAIAAHQRWKIRLKEVVGGQSKEALDPAVVGRCDVCVLGQWLAVQGNDPRIPFDVMTRLTQEHAEFHKLAADIIRLSDQGLHRQALDALRTDAPYNRSSHRVTKLLSQLYFELSEFHKPSR
ncbi:MAG: CZB domain-containing protein [Thiomonas sp.]